jgi:DNA-binding MarR family transcriptional regulator
VFVSDWSPETRLALRAYVRAVALADSLQRDLARTYSVALGDLHALRLLGDLGEATVSRLGAGLELKPSSATNLVDRLEAAGLVKRGTDPADRRVTTLALTPRAHAALEDRALVESSGLVRRVERLAPGDRLLLASLLERLLESEPDEDTAPNEAPSPRSARQPLTAARARS